MKNFKILFILFWVIMLSTKNTFSQNENPFEKYQIDTFSYNGRHAKVVVPTEPNQNRNWVWRARFWGAEPQTDLALLEKGYHIVYVDVAGLYGSPRAVDIWNGFYYHITKQYSLNEKAVLEGFSRGGLIVYNWAARNINKVACIYADAPVCDIKSWPGGLFKGEGSPWDWQQCLKAHNLDSASVLNYKNIPLYNAILVAKAGIPALHVCGDSDKVVPYEENTAKLAENYKKAGGEIEVILKEGIGHHPHSLEDPTPIVEFILKKSK